MDVLRLLTLALEVVAGLLKAFEEHGDKLFEMRLADVLPVRLRTKLAQELKRVQSKERLG